MLPLPNKENTNVSGKPSLLSSATPPTTCPSTPLAVVSGGVGMMSVNSGNQQQQYSNTATSNILNILTASKTPSKAVADAAALVSRLAIKNGTATNAQIDQR